MEPGSRPGDVTTRRGTETGTTLTAPPPDGPRDATGVVFHPISRTKVTPTPVRDTTLTRDRLMSWLRENVSRKLTLVVAEAGYGKTTLLADFSRSGHIRCLWYKLDTADRDWVTFVNYVLAAAREVAPDLGAATSGLLQQMSSLNPSRELVLNTFLSDLDALRDVPTLLILDDYHLADDSEDIQDIMGRLLREAPDSLHFVLLSRRRPGLPLTRLAAQGELAELTSEDLRFSREETDRLFGEVYGQPLEADLVDQIDARTEGWAATLQLLYSSIRGRDRERIRAFVKSLSGAEGPVYDFLAEEVLAELPGHMRRFLTHASLLERVVPGHVAALLADGDQPRPEDVQEWIVEAERLGFLDRRGATRASVRFHPLHRDFFGRQLRLSTDDAAITEMHARVAAATEEDDWLASCHHYVAANRPHDAMRVLGRSVLLALGTGQWGAASQILARLEGVELDPAATVLLARDAIEAGDLERSLSLLEGVPVAGVPALTQALVRQMRVHLAWRQGDVPAYLGEVRRLHEDPSAPSAFRDIAEAHLLIAGIGRGGRLEEVGSYLLRLGEKQSREGYHFYAGISFHNAMLAAVSQGNYEHAMDIGARALEQFRTAGPQHREPGSTQASMATCALELGSRATFAELQKSVCAAKANDPDALLELALASAITGRVSDAVDMCRRATFESAGRMDVGSGNIYLLAMSMANLAAGDAVSASGRLRLADPAFLLDMSGEVDRCLLLSIALLRSGSAAEAKQVADEGLSLATAQGSKRFIARLQVVRAVLDEDGRGLASAIRDAGATGELALLETADAIAAGVHLLENLPGELTQSFQSWPDRWRQVLRRELDAGNTAGGRAAARLLDDYGSLEDVPRLRAFARTYGKSTKLASVGKTLARRASPRLFIHDLGMTTLEVGPRRFTGTQMRRRAASLLCYLISRPSCRATREQVLDDLWPDLEPSSAGNSLNQTLYFLRRDIDPWYDEDISVNYIRLESDMIWVDLEMASVDSLEFYSAARAIRGARFDTDAAASALALYRGRFAVEFEYEEWALGWRERLHALFLAVAFSLQSHWIGTGSWNDAIELAHAVLAIDPQATDIERGLIWLYARAGAHSAAAEQYSHYAESHRSTLGLDPPSFQEIEADRPPEPLGTRRR